jgi:hypothetical protein
MPMLTVSRVTLPPAFLALKCRPLRDLAWSLLYSTLFNPIPKLPAEWFNSDYIDSTNTPYFLSWLQKIDSNPLALNKHLAEQRSTRLGIYFEQLLSFYLKYYEINGERQFDLLAKNHQVNEDKRTLGEFDFIVFDRKAQCIKHIEVAVKFYLGHQNYNQFTLKPIEKNRPLHNWHNWVGPNFRDTLAIKMRHLQEHQLQLGRTLSGSQSLMDLMKTNGYKNKIEENVTCRLHISGRFFTPLSLDIEPPTYCAQNKIENFWLYRSETNNKLEKTENSRYCLLPKQYWLSELTLEDIEYGELQLLSKEALLKFLAAETQENEWHFAIIDNNKIDAQKNNKNQILSIELGRFFIIN